LDEAYASQICFPDTTGVSLAGFKYDGLSDKKIDSSEVIKTQSRNTEEVYIIDMGTGQTKSMEIIRVNDLIGSRFCISSGRGEKLYEAIRLALLTGKKAYISFDNIADISSAFLDSAIGELYNGEFPKKELMEKITIKGLKRDDMFILSRVTERAEKFFRNPQEIETLFEHDNY
jgi:hypothetical protein